MKLVVVLHNIRSVHNVGSIFRTADAAGVLKIYLCGITPAPFDRLKTLRPDFAKVALGAHEYIAWESAKSTAAVIKKLKGEGYKICAIEQAKNAIPYFELSRARAGAANVADEKICLVLGAEVDGLPPALLKRADTILEIPMFGKKESLNVAVAFGVVAFGLRVVVPSKKWKKR